MSRFAKEHPDDWEQAFEKLIDRADYLHDLAKEEGTSPMTAEDVTQPTLTEEERALAPHIKIAIWLSAFIDYCGNRPDALDANLTTGEARKINAALTAFRDRLLNSRPQMPLPPVATVHAAVNDWLNASQTEGSAQAAPSPPPGWKLVPREPTNDMVRRGFIAFDEAAPWSPTNAWRAMYDAAPVKE